VTGFAAGAAQLQKDYALYGRSLTKRFNPARR
jgi:hypothetical protein